MTKKKKNIKVSTDTKPVTRNEKPETSSFLKRYSTEIILFMLAFFLYANVINNDYALDDVAVIQQNKFTKQGFAGIPKILHTFYWAGYWDQNAGLYRPLSMISFAIEYQFFKDNPHASHCINVLLYGLIAVLLYRTLKRILKNYDPIIPLIASVLFIIHPIHSEVVANIKSRDELLCLITFLLSLNFLLDYSEKENKKHLMLGLLFYFLSLMSKEGAIVFVAIIPLTFFFFSEVPQKKIITIGGYLFGVALVFYGIHEYVIHHAPEQHPYSKYDNALVDAPELSSRLATAIYILGRYIVMLFYPHPLSYDYSFGEISILNWGNIKVLFSFALHASLGAYAILNLKKKDIIAYGILFYFIGISLVSNTFMLIGTTMAERLLFVPSIGFCIIIAALIHKYSKNNSLDIREYLKNNTLIALLLIGVLVLSSYKIVKRNRNWKNNFTLFKQDVKACPGSSRTQYNYGTELLNDFALNEKDTAKKRLLLEECIQYLETSAKIDPATPGTFLNLSTAYYQLKKYDKVIGVAEQVIKINANEGKSYYMIGNSYYHTNQFAKAIPYLKTAGEKSFEPNESYNALGACYFGVQDMQHAIDAFNKALISKPTDTGALNNLGSAYGTIKDFDNAITTFKKSIQADSTNVNTWYFLAMTYANKGDKLNADKTYAKVQRLQKKN